MVSTKTVQNIRRGGFNGIPNRQRFKPGGGHKQLNPRNIGAMFNANQLGDNPGFLDFNDDVQIPSATTTQTNGNNATTKSTPASSTNAAAGSSASTGAGSVKGPTGGKNRKGNLNQKRQLMRNGNNMRRMPPGMNNHWGPPMPPVPHMFPMNGGRRNGPFPPPPPHFRAPPMGPRGMRGGPMMPPPPPNGRFAGPPMGPGPMSLMQRPLPPMPPMRGPMMNPMGRMIPPPLRNRADGPPMRRNPNGKVPPSRIGKAAKGTPRNAIANGKGQKAVVKKAKVKVPARPREEYTLDKPWVTEEIKAEHDKKVELADRLKGNKDDALFAQFKEQRDKFVKMYDAARLEFIGKHPEQVI